MPHKYPIAGHCQNKFTPFAKFFFRLTLFGVLMPRNQPLDAMDTSKEGIKNWLARHLDRDRNWLAEKCGVEKKTVDNWLSSPREIPAKALLIIDDLMRTDAETERPEDVEDVVAMPIRVSPMQFDDYTRAFKRASDVSTFREWIMRRLDAAAEADLASGFDSAARPFSSSEALPGRKADAL